MCLINLLINKNLKLIALLTLLSGHNYFIQTQRKLISTENSNNIYRETEKESRESLHVTLAVTVD